MKVLIVDDSTAMRMIVKRTLGQTDIGTCDIVEATNGAEGLTQVQSENPDLVLSAWNMPELSGIEFLRKLRSSGSEVRFGFITAESGNDIRSLALDSGAQFLITKPFSAQSLDSAVIPCVA